MISKLLNTVEEKLSRREFIEFKERLGRFSFPNAFIPVCLSCFYFMKDQDIVHVLYFRFDMFQQVGFQFNTINVHFN